MSKDRIRTIPNLSETSPAHIEALADREKHLCSWQYNVADHFKDKSIEEIRQSLKETSFPYAVLFENLIGDFNISTGIRNANAFNAKEVFYLGDKRFDRRGCQGVHNYSVIKWLPTIEDVLSLKNKYVFVGADNIQGSIPLDDYIWASNSIMVFGSEGIGLTNKMQSLCKDIVHINQFGSVRSINVGTASGIFMNDYVSKFNKIKRK